MMSAWRGLAVGMAGVAVCAVAVVVGGGWLTPAHHAVEVTLFSARTPADVWPVVQDLRAQVRWRPSLASVEPRPDRDGQPVFAELRLGREVPLVWLTRAEEPPDRLVREVVDDDYVDRRWTVEVEPSAEGCAVTVVEEVHVDNPVVRFYLRYFVGYESTSRQYLEELSDKLGDAGDVAAEPDRRARRR